MLDIYIYLLSNITPIFQDHINNTCNIYLSVSYCALVLSLFLPYPLLSCLAAFSLRLNFIGKFHRKHEMLISFMSLVKVQKLVSKVQPNKER